LELKAEETECLQRFKQASIATHRALRNSENEVIRAKMEGAWKADSGDIAKDQAGELRYYKEVMNCDEINQLDVDVDAARQYMNTTATAFARAETALEEHDSRVAAHKRAESERDSAVAVQAKDATQAQEVTWEEHARNIAGEFGEFVNTNVTAGFHAARGAVKQTTTFLMQLLVQMMHLYSYRKRADSFYTNPRTPQEEKLVKKELAKQKHDETAKEKKYRMPKAAPRGEQAEAAGLTVGTRAIISAKLDLAKSIRRAHLTHESKLSRNLECAHIV
jgi:hypothetical protein